MLKKERLDIDKHIEKMVEAEMEEERKKQLAEQYGEEEANEEENQEERKQSHRGRGGMSKGYGDRKQRDRGEFDGSDDEDEYSFQNAYTKPSRGGGQQVNRGKVASRGRGARVP